MRISFAFKDVQAVLHLCTSCHAYNCIVIRPQLVAMGIDQHLWIISCCVSGVGVIQDTGPGDGYKFKKGQRVVAGDW